MTETDWKAKYEALLSDYGRMAVAYGELLARLSPPLPVYPQPAPWTPYPWPWRVTSGSTSNDPPPAGPASPPPWSPRWQTVGIRTGDPLPEPTRVYASDSSVTPNAMAAGLGAAALAVALTDAGLSNP